METETNIIVTSSGPSDAASEAEAPAIATESTEEITAKEADPASNEAEDTETEDKDSEESEENDSESEPKPKKKSGFQKRLERERRKLQEKEAEIESLRRQIAQGKNPDATEATNAKPPEDQDKAPDPQDFENHADYVRALTRHELKLERQAQKEEAKKEAAKAARDSSVKSFQAKAREFQEKTKDFAEVLEGVDDIPMSPALESLFLESESGPELMYELAKNPEEYERINAMSERDAVRALGKFEGRIEARKQSQATVEPKKMTKAPAPISPVGGGGGAIAKSIHDPNITFPEYEKIRKQELSRKA